MVFNNETFKFSYGTANVTTISAGAALATGCHRQRHADMRQSPGSGTSIPRATAARMYAKLQKSFAHVIQPHSLCLLLPGDFSFGTFTLRFAAALEDVSEIHSCVTRMRTTCTQVTDRANVIATMQCYIMDHQGK